MDAKRITLWASILGSAVVFLDGTIVNVALPAIGRDLGATTGELQWILNGYLLALGSLILLGGALGDRHGRRRVFAIGTAVFTVASLLCGVAQSQGMLIGARFVQGVGGALTSAVILGMIVTMFPEPREQADGAAARGDAAVDADRLRLLLGLGEHRDDAAAHDGGGQRAAAALDDPRGDEDLLRLGDAAEDGCER